MKTNGNLLLWKKNTLFLFYIVFAFFTIIGWQLSEVSAETEICVGSVNIPAEIDYVVLSEASQKKELNDNTPEHWYQYPFFNKEDNPPDGEDHSIDVIDGNNPPEFISDLIIWEVYDRDGNCVATGQRASEGDDPDRFGPSFKPYDNNSLPSDIYIIRIIRDSTVSEAITYSLIVSGSGIPKVYGIINDALDGKELPDVTITSNLSQNPIFSKPSGSYILSAPDANHDLNYDLDGYKPLELTNFDTTIDDYYPQNVILCPNEVAIIATPTSGDAPLTVTFDLPDVTNPAADFAWDFGDGMPIDNSDPPVSNTYFDPGTYTVNVTVSVTLPVSESVTKEIECTVTSSVNVEVRGEPPPPPPPNGKPLLPAISFLLF